MRIAVLVAVSVLPLAGLATAQQPRPSTPKPCVTMPRQGAAPAERPRERCIPVAFPRSERR
jgi:hypothetical protein